MEFVNDIRPRHLTSLETQVDEVFGLVVIWPVANRNEAAVRTVLEDLQQRFCVVAFLAGEWSRESAPRNFERFYCDRDFPGQKLMALKGLGPFHVAVVHDKSPNFAPRNAPQGVEIVNTNFFDAKQEYRKWLGREHGIHISDHQREGWRDLALMLGPAALSELRATSTFMTEHVVTNTYGLEGWKTVDEALSILNHTARHVLLSDPETSEAEGLNGRPLQILTEEYRSTIQVLNAAGPRGVVPRWGGVFEVRLTNGTVPVEIRFVGDEYLPPEFAASLLDNRVLRGKVYVPSTDDALKLAIYRSVAYPQIGSVGDGRVPSVPANETLLAAELRRPTVPRDVTANFDFRLTGYHFPILRKNLRTCGKIAFLVGVYCLAEYRLVRTEILTKVPWLRRFRRRLRKMTR